MSVVYTEEFNHWIDDPELLYTQGFLEARATPYISIPQRKHVKM